ncbi:hypothetical protein CONLIGDRAFT_84816 [Coniochaeta ligniaria NRRL 30616]|uniref:Uncharacterized protein n=1 Tax=Coniochaeta ligniaria NRRL 30616 TaxID=1408157 RepID=A0A1J7J5W9_9PEZI|nr:hypothetical protein CONLIGDRAFT_84816 [Coniochaeta ligniaria NRRL 30616]
MPSLTPLRALRPLTNTSRPLTLTLASRQLHTTPRPQAYKDDQDRESLKPKAPYGSQSAGDEAASHNPDSYSRKKTDPSREKKDNPEELDVSGANQDLSKPQGDNAAEESRPSGPDRKERSGGSTGKGKAGKPDV